jgi:hypothetical protein
MQVPIECTANATGSRKYLSAEETVVQRAG